MRNRVLFRDWSPALLEFGKQESECGGLTTIAKLLITRSEKGVFMDVSAKNTELAAATTTDPRWASVVARNANADGKFFYSVKTTGVYCRPSCPSCLARPENVRFHTTTKDAENAGFRPCKRCKPNQPLIRFAIGESSMGLILVAKSGRGICAIFMGDDPGQLVRDIRDRFPHTNLIDGDGDFEQLVSKVVGFVEAPAVSLALPLDVRGTAFQQRVWQALREIPVGSTASYTDIAKRIGSPKSVRAVAQACAANPLALAIPCHRVVKSDGVLSGYRWGVERKRALLEREAHA
jgi:AraC family transcriptional regulator, regulatory protein of adaptative response / methylated-DNA-[protein]-cysteine methyltransferase